MHARPIYIISLMCNVLLLFSVLWVYSSGGSSGDAVLPSAQMSVPLSPPVAAAPEAAALASSQQQRQQSSLVQPAAGLSARAPLPTGMVSYDTLEAAAAAIAEPMRWGGKGTVVFVSGNLWMVDFMLNEMVHLAQHAVPWRVLWVPLDTGALERLNKYGNGSVYTAVAASGRFTGARSDFKQQGYQVMSMFKWELSLELLELGYDVLVIDPDLVLMRNPLPYIETLGDCDFYFSLDVVDMDPTSENVRSQGGYVCHDKSIALNYYNTGGAFLRARPRSVAWLRSFNEWAAEEIRLGDVYDDQALFNKFITALHAMPADKLSGDYTADAVMANACLDYRRVNAAAAVDAANDVVATFYPLNPWLFLPSRQLTIRGLQKRMLHRPFWWHANWVYGEGKQPLIASQGDWLYTGELLERKIMA